jgi:hypothetical protein
MIDIADFKDRAGFAYLLMAANPQLTVRDTQAVLSNVGEQHERPAGWISRRRWLFHGLGKTGMKPNADGQDERARLLMVENPHLSSRQTVYLLREHGIRRDKTWVLKNRVST